MRRVSLIMMCIALAAGLTGCGKGESGHTEAGEHAGHGHDHDHDHEAGGMEVEVSEAQIKAVGITLGSMEKRHIDEVVQASGILEVGAQSEGLVTPKVGGRVVKLDISRGQRVSAGQVVASIEVPQLQDLRQQIAEAKQEIAAARREVDRQEALAAQGAGIRKNLDNARSVLSMAEVKLAGVRRQLEQYGASGDENGSNVLPVKSEVSGVVTQVDVPVGGYADAQQPIARVVNTNAVFCTLRVLEKDISKLKPGMDVEMQLTNDPSGQFLGRIADILPMVDTESYTVPVKVTLASNSSGLTLMPGMAVSGRISTGGGATDALPESAVVTSGGKSYIFVLEKTEEENGEKMYHFEKREVVSGLSALGYVSVVPLEELPADAEIVINGAFYLNSMVSDHGEHNH